MSLSVGIVGLPNVGKSTLFNALLNREIASVSEYPFTTIKPNTGVVKVPDERVQVLSQALGIEKKVPSVVKFIDIAGLVKGAHEGKGLGNRFLTHIRQADAILHVLRGFVSKTVSHVNGQVDPVHDLTTVNLELVLADFETVVKKLKSTKKKDEKKILEKAKKILSDGEMLADHDFSKKGFEVLKPLNLLTLKPTLYLLNLNDSTLTASKGWDDWPKDDSETDLPPTLICSAQMEAEISSLDDKTQQEYLQTIEMKKPVLDRLIRRAYQTLGLITFFTVKGKKQVQAWPIKKGATAIEAAARVHTDFAQRFIKAELIDWQKLTKFRSWPEAKQAGAVDLVGRDKMIKDGQVIEFKFGR